MKKDEHYYQTHPNELQQAIKSCPEQQPQGMTCNQIQEIAGRMNSLAYQLQQSPQGFGNKILALQETLAAQEQKLKTDANNKELQASIAQSKHDLDEYLAVVKWLESPVS
jgi:anti-sigma factor ChrR (cupin superfamily)